MKEARKPPEENESDLALLAAAFLDLWEQNGAPCCAASDPGAETEMTADGASS